MSKGYRDRTRNRLRFRANMEAIDWSKRAPSCLAVVNKKAGKTTYVYKAGGK